MAATGPNELRESASVPAWRKMLEQFRNPLIYLLLGAILISLAAWWLEGRDGLPYDAIVIAVIVVLNAVLGYVQESRAEQAVSALRRMSAPTATVLRDAALARIPASELVLGDVLVLGEGDSIAADARLLSSSTLRVSEASLTGESEPVLKDNAMVDRPVPLGDQHDMVFSGTAVTQGVGRAVVTATGMATQTGQIADLLETTREEPTPLQRQIAGVGRMLGMAVLVFAVTVVGTVFVVFDVDSAQEAVTALLLGVSLAVAAVPEGLPAILSVVLALGVQRMAARQAIVKDLSSVETLGSASVICTDKAGTLTRNEMIQLSDLDATYDCSVEALDLALVGLQPPDPVRERGGPYLDLPDSVGGQVSTGDGFNALVPGDVAFVALFGLRLDAFGFGETTDALDAS